MPIQALSSQNSITLHSVLNRGGLEFKRNSYHDLLIYENQNTQKKLDHFLMFSQVASSQNFSAALAILEDKDIAQVKEPHHFVRSPKQDQPPRQIFDCEGRVVQYLSSDGSIDYKLSYDGNLTTITNQVTGEIHIQEIDKQGRLIREVLPCGLETTWKFEGDHLSEVTFPDQSKVVYQNIDENQMNIQRQSSNGEVQYQHAYLVENNNLINEVLIGELGNLQRVYDESSKTLTTHSEHLHLIDQYDDDRNLISRTMKDFTEQKGALTEFNSFAEDLIFGEKRRLDNLGRVTHYNGFNCSFDEKGRLIKKVSENQIIQYGYDAFDRLISVEIGNNKKIKYTYDLSGRRLSKTVTEKKDTRQEFYLYHGVNQVGVYDKHKEPFHLRILGGAVHTHLPLAIAIESQSKVYAPIHSSNFNIVQLIDKDSKEVIHYKSLYPFGENLQNLNPICPWIFATKHYDSDTGLVDFGDRQYDPSIKQWTSADPDSRAAGDEIYSYCNNNPLKFIDPDGNFAIFIPLTQGLWAAGAAILTGIGAWAAKKGADHINENQKPRRENKNNPRMDNDVKNPEYKDAAKEVEQDLGRKLTKEELELFHRHVSGQGYGYHEMVDEGFHLFDDRYRHN